MTFKNTLSVRFLAPLLLVSGLAAAPRLNLVQTALTISVPVGANGPTFTLDTFNIGSGTLDLTASSSVAWLVPTVGTSQVCGLRGGCYPVSIAFNTSSLAAGTYTGVITLTDPNAVDSPQIFTVTAQVGGDVPSNLVFYLAPGTSTSTTFTTNGQITANEAGTPWLSTSTSANPSSSDYVTSVKATASSTMAATEYNGTITISGSSFAPDNKQIAVVLHVTTQPIVQTSSNAVNFSVPQGTQAQTQNVLVSNAGQGTLTVSGVNAVANTGTWLTATSTTSAGVTTVAIKADPTGLSPNTYTGNVTISNNGVNASNGSVVLPVTLVVTTQGTPYAAIGGVVNNGNFAAGEPLAQGEVAAIFGSQFSFDVPQFAQSVPLPTTLDGVQVLVNGQAAPLFNVYPGQIDFQVPFNAATGAGTIQIVRNGQMGNLIYVDIAAAVPTFIDYDGGYAIVTKADGFTVTGTPQTQPVAAGDTIVIYALGLGPTSPAVTSGAPAPSGTLAKVPGTTQVCFGVETPFSPPPCVTPSFVGLSPGSVGLYQLNITIPTGLKAGNTTMALIVENNIASDSALLAVQ